MITILIILVTALVSYSAFQKPELFSKLQFNAYQAFHSKQYYRLFSHGFIHADWGHLIFNMISLYFFGSNVEHLLESRFMYVVLYLSAIGIASITSLIKYRNNYYYNSVGASGGVSAVIFASILLEPGIKIIILPIPIPIPGIIYGLIFLAYSHFMSKRGRDNINHDAHLLGAVYGFLFPLLINPEYFSNFIRQINL
jgi:membrane associated rhomboid family serine protease